MDLNKEKKKRKENRVCLMTEVAVHTNQPEHIRTTIGV